MAQRTRTTTARAALAGAAIILGAGLTGCMGDGKKPVKAVGQEECPSCGRDDGGRDGPDLDGPE